MRSNRSKREEVELQQQKTMPGSNFVNQKQKAKAAVGRDSPKLDS